MNSLRISVDFHNSDGIGRVRLNTVGSLRDLNNSGVVLKDGVNLVIYCDELEADAEAFYSHEEGIWTAKIDWNKVRRREAN